jgi:hypothetical protein
MHLWHGILYFFLKSLRILEEFRKNPCVKIPLKSSCANFQSLGKYKNLIFISKRNFFQLLAQSAQPAFFFLPVLNRAGTTATGLVLPPSAALASPAMEPLP